MMNSNGPRNEDQVYLTVGGLVVPVIFVPVIFLNYVDNQHGSKKISRKLDVIIKFLVFQQNLLW